MSIFQNIHSTIDGTTSPKAWLVVTVRNLKLTFKDGKKSQIIRVTTSDEAENRKYIYDNVLKNHETLSPLGEFAIGTNTIAYVVRENMALKHWMPILIAEKTHHILQ